MVFPRPGDVLPLNGRIVISTDGDGIGSDELTPALLEMELRGDAERIPLEAVRTLGDNTETTLTPKGALRPTTRYELHRSDGQPIKLQRYRSAPIGWVTEATQDHLAPRWSAAPIVLSATNEGPRGGLWVRLSVPIEGDEPVAFVVEIGPVGQAMPIGSNSPMRHFVQPKAGVITLGGGPCGGLFELSRGRHYLVKLTAYDAAGNRSPTRRLEVVTPG